MSIEVQKKLSEKGVFRGLEGLEGLAGADDFWEKQSYGTRLYYGPNAFDYLHRSVLKAAIKIIKETP